MPTRELAVLQSILTKALVKARESRAGHIQTVQLALGELYELDQPSIQRHWDEISRGTPAEHARLHFRLIQGEVQCMACFAKYHPAHGEIHCPHCGSYGAKILAGEEFYLESIELNDE